MKYKPFTAPPGTSLREVSREQLIAYYDWFMQNKTPRIAEVAALIADAPGFKTWRPDHSPDSLTNLGNWMEGEVTLRPKTREEIADERQHLLFNVDAPDTVLTDRTFSIACDVGMYLGETLVRNHNHVEWAHCLADKRAADYGHPVLVGFGRNSVNPIRLTLVLAYGIGNGTQGGTRLRELYDYWSARATRH